MKADRFTRVCHGLSLAAIAVAVVTMLSVIWSGLHDWTWQLLASALAVFAGARAIVAVDRWPGAPWHA